MYWTKDGALADWEQHMYNPPTSAEVTGSNHFPDNTMRYFRVYKRFSRWELEVVLPHTNHHLRFKTKTEAQQVVHQYHPDDDDQLGELFHCFGGGNCGWVRSHPYWLNAAHEAAKINAQAEHADEPPADPDDPRTDSQWALDVASFTLERFERLAYEMGTLDQQFELLAGRGQYHGLPAADAINRLSEMHRQLRHILNHTRDAVAVISTVEHEAQSTAVL